VTLLHGRAMPDIQPSNGQVLTWVGDTTNGSWVPQMPLVTGGGGGGGGGGGPVGLGGDLSGSTNQATVARLRNQALSTTPASVDGQVLRWSANRVQWEPQIAPGTVVAAGRIGQGQFQAQSYLGNLTASGSQLITLLFDGFDGNRFNYVLRTEVGTVNQNNGNEQPYFVMAVNQNFSNNLSFSIFRAVGSQLTPADLDQDHFITIEVAAYPKAGVAPVV